MAQYGYWHIDIFPWMNWKSSSTAGSTRTNTSSALGMGYLVTATSINQHIEWDVPLTTGTWTLTLIWRSGTGNAIITPSIDGVDLATFDGYEAAPVQNKVTQWTGISIITDGIKEIRFRGDSKNASASGYAIQPQLINFTRTA